MIFDGAAGIDISLSPKYKFLERSDVQQAFKNWGNFAAHMVEKVDVGANLNFHGAFAAFGAGAGADGGTHDALNIVAGELRGELTHPM